MLANRLRGNVVQPRGMDCFASLAMTAAGGALDLLRKQLVA
jgi:hypothetical protein